MYKYINSFTSTPEKTAWVNNPTPPSVYRSFEIYRNAEGAFDLTYGGVCISQRKSLKGAKGFVDMMYFQPEHRLVKRAWGFYARHCVEHDTHFEKRADTSPTSFSDS